MTEKFRPIRAALLEIYEENTKGRKGSLRISERDLVIEEKHVVVPGSDYVYERKKYHLLFEPESQSFFLHESTLGGHSLLDDPDRHYRSSKKISLKSKEEVLEKVSELLKEYLD